ncbi:putative serine threonine kinase tip30 cc3 protein [Phaeoacremonium minimum UCRPA7]|uniref:Putative serine threonine kinase tip30 cc3 protein n=1 Tax=Phaeoacremonium minimum (strain UCR-PA7) TaxID=1286976 RepID=R8BQZ9_PHAM7|nr:putative serine threonine kinase tip30 cc3 protein [Phaeoacremonium minimum UCRPA7]EOO01776.1 putative serine threonine kinase tip30 cc3 protein [Phaeoacremonium minimum UCRPA7]
MTTTAVFGSTGLVGSNILSTLLSSDLYAAVVHTVSRRAPKADSPKLHATVDAESDKWPEKLSSLDPVPTTVYSALGTTRAAAGGIANQWKIDHDLNVEIAKAAKAAGVKTFVFISSAGVRGMLSGAAPYSKMKVGVEDAIKELDFEHAVIVRPGLILGEREVPKTPWINGLVHKLGQGMQDSFAAEADVIARAAVAAAKLAEDGKAPEKYWVVDQKAVIRLGRTEWKE